MNRLPLLLFVLLLALVAVLVLVVARPESVLQRGLVHADFSTMQQGGSGERHEGLLLLGWSAGVLMIGFFVGLVRLGLGRLEEQVARSVGRWLVGGGLAFFSVWTALVLVYRGTRGDRVASLMGSFPPATALMLYGIWAVPVVFAVLYVWRFDQWIGAGAERLLAARSREVDTAVEGKVRRP